jgi:hypothetical protein
VTLSDVFCCFYLDSLFILLYADNNNVLSTLIQVYTWPGGKKFDGTYKNGLKDGYGRTTWPDGRMYCGAFRKGKREGRGIQTDADGNMVHCGQWKSDAPFIKGGTPSPSMSAEDLPGGILSIRDSSRQQRYHESAQNTSEEDIVFMESQAVAVADDSHTTTRSSALKAAISSANKELSAFPAHSKSTTVQSGKGSGSLASTVKTIPATPSKLLDDVSSMGGSFDLDHKEPSFLLGSFERISL